MYICLCVCVRPSPTYRYRVSFINLELSRLVLIGVHPTRKEVQECCQLVQVCPFHI